MPLNKQQGNMYGFITHTWNPLGGECPHRCTYCSTKSLMRYPAIKAKYTGPLRIIEHELKTNLGSGNYIFVCAQNDLFANRVSKEIINKILGHCSRYTENKYLFQTKNPIRYIEFLSFFTEHYTLGTTIETNRITPLNFFNIPVLRFIQIGILKNIGYKTFITIEPIVDFDLNIFLDFIKKLADHFPLFSELLQNMLVYIKRI